MYFQDGAVEPGAADETAALIAPSAVPAGGGAQDAQEVPLKAAPLADDTAQAVIRRPTPLSSFKSELVRAMQVAADRECERIDAGVGEEEAAQVEKIHVRAAAGAAELSKHADDDVSLVNAWYENQVQGIREEADRRIDDCRKELERSLAQHGSLIEVEIHSVHAALQGYRASLGAFFARLADEQDPSVMARLAGTLPDLPDLDEVRAEACSGAIRALGQVSLAEVPDRADESSADGNGWSGLERELTPVMDPDAVTQRVSILSGVAIPVARPGPSALSAAQPSSSPTDPEGEATASPPEVQSPEGNDAVPAIHASTIWMSASGDSEGP